MDLGNAEGEGMADIIETNTDITPVNNVFRVSDNMLDEVRREIQTHECISFPVGKLSSLGAGVSSLIPAFRTATSTVDVNMQGLFRVANASSGDVLKMASDGTYWGAMKTAQKTSKMAKFAQAGPISEKISTVAPINPATIMMAATLMSIEKKLDEIEETQKQILEFLENEKEAKIEGDVETLQSIIAKYKNSWDDPLFISSNHKLVIDIQRSARQDIKSLTKAIDSLLKSRQLVTVQAQVKAKTDTLLKKFEYYRLAVFNFSMASMIEVMLSGNFREAYINEVKNEIDRITDSYREKFEEGSYYLEKMSKSSIESNLLKGMGDAQKSAGKFIHSIPVIEKGSVDELLLKGASRLKKNASNMENDVLGIFGKMYDPKTGIFTSRLELIERVYNHTSQIYFDKDKVYLLGDK